MKGFVLHAASSSIPPSFLFCSPCHHLNHRNKIKKKKIPKTANLSLSWSVELHGTKAPPGTKVKSKAKGREISSGLLCVGDVKKYNTS